VTQFRGGESQDGEGAAGGDGCAGPEDLDFDVTVGVEFDEVVELVAHGYGVHVGAAA
jgi:hypothetical protein